MSMCVKSENRIKRLKLISKPELDNGSLQDNSFYWSFSITPLLVIPMPWILRTCFLSESLVLETEPHRWHDTPALSMCFDSIWVLRFCFLLKKALHSLQLKPPWDLTIIWRTAASVTSGRKISVEIGSMYQFYLICISVTNKIGLQFKLRIEMCACF